MVDYLTISSLHSGIAGGLIGAIIIFPITLTGVSGHSQAVKALEKTVWKNIVIG